MTDKTWNSVDRYFGGRLIADAAATDAALAANRKAGLPEIDVSPLQGKLLALLVRMIGARRILEVGTLGGYSTIWMARALPADGRLVTLELDAHHAEVARGNFAAAGVADRIESIEGPAGPLAAIARRSGTNSFSISSSSMPISRATRSISTGPRSRSQGRGHRA